MIFFLEEGAMENTRILTDKERRAYKRYNALDGSFAAISPNSFKLGQIIDISKGGLAFQYIQTNRNSKYNTEEKYIFLSSKGYYVHGIPFKTVADIPIPTDNPFSSITMRRCSIQFGEMEFEQKVELENYILNNTAKYDQY